VKNIKSTNHMKIKYFWMWYTWKMSTDGLLYS